MMQTPRVRWLFAALAVGAPMIGHAQSSGTAQAYTFTTFAGGPPAGSSDGTGSAAKFNQPFGMVTDRSGVLFVTDSGNHTIRKISASGVVTTVAGLAGSAGDADGPVSAARFNSPLGVAADASGNLFIAGAANLIRRISPDGVVTTLAGAPGTQGNADGTGAAARFNGPAGLAVDAAGNVYVADSINCVIRKITPGGVVTTLAGTPGTIGSSDGVGRAAQFWFPVGVAIDVAGNLYVADTFNSLIRKVTPDGTVTTLAGVAGGPANGFGYVDGAASVARFGHPRGIAVDGKGNVYVADTENHAVRKLTAAGVVTTLGGGGGTSGNVDGAGTAARFNLPSGLVVDDAGNVFVADTGNHAIRKGIAVVVGDPSNPGRLINLSVLAPIAAAGDSFSLGYVVDGASATNPKPLVIRAAGPALGEIGYPGVIADPKLELFAGPTKTTENDNWGGVFATSTAMAAVGAFPYTISTSRDAAVVGNIASRDNSVRISAGASAPNGTGAVLAEVYDATPPASFNAVTTPRLVNFSVLKNVGASVTLGFVIGGTTTQTVLVRAIGPSLGLAPFNLGGVMPDPKVELFDAESKSITTNDNWGGAATLSAAFTSTGAFTLPTNSKDAALVAALVPGNYTVVVTPASGTVSGIALLEVYSVR